MRMKVKPSPPAEVCKESATIHNVHSKTAGLSSSLSLHQTAASFSSRRKSTFVDIKCAR